MTMSLNIYVVNSVQVLIKRSKEHVRLIRYAAKQLDLGINIPVYLEYQNALTVPTISTGIAPDHTNYEWAKLSINLNNIL